MPPLDHWLAGDQIQGGRDYQEDAFRPTLFTVADDRAAVARLLLVLADGMGGHAGGGVASDTAVQAFGDGFGRPAADVPARLAAGIAAANREVRARQAAEPALSEMGTTLVAAAVEDGRLHWASVGDSPLWLWRAGGVERLNADHSMRPVLRDLVEMGRLTEDEARTDPRVHQLRSVLGGDDDVPLLDLPAAGRPLRAGDVVLLASDGLETLPEDRIAALVADCRDDARAIVRALLDAVTAAGRPGQDNTTVVAYRAGDDHDSLSATWARMEAPTAGSATPRHALHVQPAPPARTAPSAPARFLAKLIGEVLGRGRESGKRKRKKAEGTP